MNTFFYKLSANVKDIFRGKNLLLHVTLISLTAVLVLSGFDAFWYDATRNATLIIVAFSTALVGFMTPVFLPLIMYFQGRRTGNARFTNAAFASIQSGLLGLVISSTYKVFTGRVGLPYGGALEDTSRVFRFGIYRGGAFQGWPSSHTAVAFAMSVALITLFPDRKSFRYMLLAYAFYIGLGVSMTIHWFSDFAAGAILGSLIGLVVGRSYLKRINE